MFISSAQWGHLISPPSRGNHIYIKLHLETSQSGHYMCHSHYPSSCSLQQLAMVLASHTTKVSLISSACVLFVWADFVCFGLISSLDFQSWSVVLNTSHAQVVVFGKLCSFPQTHFRNGYCPCFILILVILLFGEACFPGTYWSVLLVLYSQFLLGREAAEAGALLEVPEGPAVGLAERRSPAEEPIFNSHSLSTGFRVQVGSGSSQQTIGRIRRATAEESQTRQPEAFWCHDGGDDSTCKYLPSSVHSGSERVLVNESQQHHQITGQSQQEAP